MIVVIRCPYVFVLIIRTVRVHILYNSYHHIYQQLVLLYITLVGIHIYILLICFATSSHSLDVVICCLAAGCHRSSFLVAKLRQACHLQAVIFIMAADLAQSKHIDGCMNNY